MARNSNVLTYSSYSKLGGLEGAIAKRADEVVDGIPSAVPALPSVLRALATMSMTNENVPVSRPAYLATFGSEGPARQLVDALIDARLLIADQADTAPVVRLAHEALIGRWQRAKEQLVADRRDLETRALIEDQFRRYRNEQDPGRRLLRNRISQML